MDKIQLESINKLAMQFPKKGKELIKAIIDTFADNNYIFKDDKHFQYAFGFALQRIFDDLNLNYRVLFEKAFLDEGTPFFALPEYIRKIYYVVDLVVDMFEKGKVGIILKYNIALPPKGRALEYDILNQKTWVYLREPNNYFYNNIQEFSDMACYEFWRDVNKVERLKSTNELTDCFAVMLTNDYNCQKEKENSFKNFSLIEDKIFSGKISLFDTKKKKDVDRFQYKIKRNNSAYYYYPIELNGNYRIMWEEYKLPNITKCRILSDIDDNVYKDYQFNYAILEI